MVEFYFKSLQKAIRCYKFVDGVVVQQWIFRKTSCFVLSGGISEFLFSYSDSFMDVANPTEEELVMLSVEHGEDTRSVFEIATSEGFEDFLIHISKRNLVRDRSVVVDFKNQLVYKYLYNLSGQLVGYQKYNWRGSKTKSNNIDGKYYTYITKESKNTKLVVMGLENVDITKTLYVVEGMFELLWAQKYGVNCVAVLTNNPKPLKNWFNTLPCKTVALCQNDAAGLKLRNLCDTYCVLSKDLDEFSSYREFLRECSEDIVDYRSVVGYRGDLL